MEVKGCADRAHTRLQDCRGRAHSDDDQVRRGREIGFGEAFENRNAERVKQIAHGG